MSAHAAQVEPRQTPRGEVYQAVCHDCPWEGKAYPFMGWAGVQAADHIVQSHRESLAP